MSSTLTPVTGTLHEVDGQGVVRMETRCRTSPDDLWEALTTPERLARWIGDVSGDLEPGGTFRAAFASSWTGSGRVEVCDPPRRLLVRLSDEDGETHVEATLTPDEGGVLLVVQESGLPLPQLPAYGAGWQVHLEDLGHHLAGTGRAGWHTRWQELIPAYQDRPVG
ncbi:MAG: SRPBCC family protein [Janthinobacterium lividum]